MTRTMIEHVLVLATLFFSLVTAGRYSHPSELSKIIIPTVVVGVILIIMLALFIYFYVKKNRGCACGCRCCKEYFYGDIAKMDNCNCSSRKGVMRLSSIDSLDSSCGNTCRCEKLRRDLEKAPEPCSATDNYLEKVSEPSSPTENQLCALCSTSNVVKCHNCSMPSDCSYPRLLRPDQLRSQISVGSDVEIDKDNLSTSPSQVNLLQNY